jgi:large conductance mechanosensitive channel
MLEDFRKFISRGSVINLAIGVIMGAAFTSIVNSLVEDMIMPIIGVLMGGIDFETLAFQVGDASINYGLFIQSVINFLLISLVIFFTMRAVVALDTELGGDDEPEAEKVPEIPEEIKLLTEIRDLLSENPPTIGAD